MKTIDDFSFSGKKALVRVDFNVPLNDQFEITDFTRINAALPSMQKMLEQGAAVILMSHLGRPKDAYAEKFSLKHIVGPLGEKLGREVQFSSDCIGEEAEQKAANLKAGEVLLLENLRFHKEEKKGDRDFAQQLAKLGDIYVNDAFGTAHRAHASTSIVAEFFEEKAAGYVMKAELDNAEMVLGQAEKPFTAIMGGAKISDKILVIEKLLDKVDHLLIGGGMAYTFFDQFPGQF
ncbi:MAG: phosphoglycerate kinase, partial [Bacteroidota bacterium]